MSDHEPAGPAPERIVAVDLLRGAVMILMALDHVRVFAGVPAGGPEPAVFFTRWVTHFCAPVFVFLAGASAWFHGRRHGDLRRWLVTRGLWLVLLELTVVRFGWTFNFDYTHFIMAGVLWAIGWSMVALSLLVGLSPRRVGLLGVAVIALQHFLPWPQGDTVSAWWKLGYVGFWAGPIPLGPDGPSLTVLYSFVPWVGVMAAGYGFAPVLRWPAVSRDRACLAIGLGATLLFVGLRGTGVYGDPRPWNPAGDMPAWLAFLDTSKYPASLQFLAMTLGPAIALVPALERARGAVAEVVAGFGRVPFFYYLLHLPLIHLLAVAVSFVRTGAVDPWLFGNHPMAAGPAPDGHRWELWLLYGVTAAAVALLAAPCRWFDALRRRRRHEWPWLAYF